MCVNQSKRRTKEKAEVEGEKVVVEVEVEVEEKVAEEERLVSLLKKIVTNMSKTFLVEKCFLKEHNLLLLIDDNVVDNDTTTTV